MFFSKSVKEYLKKEKNIVVSNVIETVYKLRTELMFEINKRDIEIDKLKEQIKFLSKKYE